jgi:hypothetical protein
MNSAEIVVKVSQLSRKIEEASAKGFKENANALNLVSELKDTVELLEELAHREFAQ